MEHRKRLLQNRKTAIQNRKKRLPKRRKHLQRQALRGLYQRRKGKILRILSLPIILYRQLKKLLRMRFLIRKYLLLSLMREQKQRQKRGLSRKRARSRLSIRKIRRNRRIPIRSAGTPLTVRFAITIPRRSIIRMRSGISTAKCTILTETATGSSA